MSDTRLSRRGFIKLLGLSAAGLFCKTLFPFSGDLFAQEISDQNHIRKIIPSSGERIPVIGMGTWITFNVRTQAERDARAEVLRTFFELGGGAIDSSPMYGNAEAVIGYGLEKLGPQKSLFSTSKIWTVDGTKGEEQFNDSRRLWGVSQFDLFFVHNMLNWPAHLKTLNDLKREGKVRYLGVTTSHQRRHRELEKILLTQDLDFIQVTYNIMDRAVEDRILPMAKERGVAVMINRPFQGGPLIDRVKQHPLPPWAEELHCANWAQFLLKFIVSHPAVTCAIPATSRVDHMVENMGAAYGRLPDVSERERMIQYVRSL